MQPLAVISCFNFVRNFVSHNEFLLQFFSSMSVTAILKLYGDSNVSVRQRLQMYRTCTYDQTICVAIKDIFLSCTIGIPLKSLEQDAVLKLYLKKIILSYEKRKGFSGKKL